MKKYIFTTVLLLCIHQVIAQPVLNQPDLAPAPGDNFISYEADTSIQPGPGGANVQWAYNNLNISNIQTTASFIDPLSTPYSGAFPLSTAAMGDSGYFNYYQSTASNFLILGEVSGTDTLVHTPPISLLCFPLTYLTQCPISNYAFSLSGDSVSGSYELEGDGYGSLEINGQIFNNILRVREQHLESFFLTGVGNLHTDRVKYYYYGSYKNPILTISTVVTTGFISGTNKYVTVNSIITGIQNVNAEPLNVSIYPNPVRSDLFINFDKNLDSEMEIRVSDSKGNCVIQKHVPSVNCKIDVSNLENGIFTLQVFSKKSKAVRRFVHIKE